jgi:hypothetical protein
MGEKRDKWRFLSGQREEGGERESDIYIYIVRGRRGRIGEGFDVVIFGYFQIYLVW